MVQHIRPPQGLDYPQRQPEYVAKPVREGDRRVEADSGASTPVSTPTREQVEQAASRINEVLHGTTSRLEFEIDHDLNRMDKVVIKILNGESGEVIRQIPAQELLDLAKYLDAPKGLLIRERA